MSLKKLLADLNRTDVAGGYSAVTLTLVEGRQAADEICSLLADVSLAIEVLGQARDVCASGKYDVGCVRLIEATAASLEQHGRVRLS